MSRFAAKKDHAAAKLGSLRRMLSLKAVKGASQLRTRRCCPSLAAVKQASPRWTRRLASKILPSTAAKGALSR